MKEQYVGRNDKTNEWRATNSPRAEEEDEWEKNEHGGYAKRGTRRCLISMILF